MDKLFFHEPLFYYPLKDWRFYHIGGPDAQDFLQRISSQNYKQAPLGQAKDMALLSATGDVLGYSIGWNLTAQLFGFAIHVTECEIAHQKLQQFVFSEQLEIKPLPDLSAVLVFSADQSMTPHLPFMAQNLKSAGEYGTWHVDDMQGVWLTRSGCGMSDVWLIGQQAQTTKLINKLEQLSISKLADSDFNFFRIRRTWPLPGIDYDEDSMILSVGLEKGVAFNKGCYPGQEVVERATAIGASPKKLRTFALETLPAQTAPLPILIEGKAVGTMTSIAERDGKILGLGTIKTKYALPEQKIIVGDVSGKLL